MAKSRYADRFREGNPILEGILDDQIGRLGRAVPRDRKSTLEDWVDLGKAEAAVKERYLGRYLFELIQNANDAIVDAQDEPNVISTDNHLVRLEITEQSLLVANYGKPFGPDNVRALCRLHKTTKSASKQIGHKGIGFKSVLEITGQPEVYSDIFAFGYDGQQFHRDVQRVMGSGWDSDQPLPILRAPYPRYLTRLPPAERECIEALFDDGYVTVIRLPFAEPDTVEEVVNRVEEDINPTLLLFMTAISQIELCFPDGREAGYYRHVVKTTDPVLNKVLLYHYDDEGNHVDSHWLMLGPIERELSDRSKVAGLGEAWQEVAALRFALAFPFDEAFKRPLFSDTSHPFYVYYPTQEFSGLQFAVHADFYVGDDRKTLPLIDLNKWLMEEICAYLTSDGLELLKKYWPDQASLVETLAPINRPERAFAQAFMEMYLCVLGLAPFVPIDGGQYKAPTEICFPPSEVDQEQFRRRFPAARLRGSDRWAYPIQEVVEFERARNVPFLLSNELGGRVVSPETVVSALKQDGMPAIDDCYELIEFLADWFSDLPGYKRSQFAACLRELPIFPTANGWQTVDSDLVFQANLRPNVEDIAAPSGFEFSVIVRSVYPTRGGSYSAQYRLFQHLGAKDYSARDLIRDAVLPILTDEERFETLLSEHPHSIYDVYRLLKQYYSDDGSTTNIRERLNRVPVPATDGQPNGWSGWKPAQDCYLGRNWPGGDILERLYTGFDDCFFLADIPELDLSADDVGRREWKSFFCWLGVMDRPKASSAPNRLREYSSDPFGDSILWREYQREYNAHFRCQNTARNHGYSRFLDSAHTLHHFADLAQEQSPQKLVDLYSLLARYWSTGYRYYAHAELSCQYVSTGCPSERVENYFLYQLRHAAWLPAQIGDGWTKPLSPQQIWILGETDPVDVRNLVPTLPVDLRVGDYRDLAFDLQFISSSSAQIEDYIRLLELLPERYPLEGVDLTDDERKRWHKSVRAVFNWICERIQTGLVSRGDAAPPRPYRLKVLAFREEQPCYVDVNSRELVYPDNSFLAERWKSHCAFLRINDDMRKLQDWLGVNSLSNIVESSWTWGGELEAETAALRKRFEDTLPYFLSLIKQSQPTNYASLLSRLERLRVHIVKDLTVDEKLGPLPNIEPISSAERLHLEKTDDPNPRGGNPVRGGDLYATLEVLDNLYLLGEYIADYIEIARMGDAFVLLLDLDAEDKKRKFLESKGISLEDLKQVFADLQAEYEETTQPGQSDEVFNEIIEKTVHGAKTSVAAPTPVESGSGEERSVGEEEVGSGQPEGGDTRIEFPIKRPTPSYPALVLDVLPDILFVEPIDEVTAPVSKPTTGGGGGGGGPGHIPSPEVTEELGRRGEKWAYQAEKKRLAGLGFDPDELEEMEELVWVSKKKPTANYDIRSIRIAETGEQRTVYIEVKASSGDSREVRMGRSEFELALSLGDDYWLYWVAHVDNAQPEPPVCYPNLARLLAEKKVDLNIDTIAMTLPKQTRVIMATDDQGTQ